MKLRRMIAVPLLLLAAATAARAQEAPVPIARVSVASMDAVNKFIADLGIPGVPPDIKSVFENSPFLGTGTIDGTKPMGIVVVAGNNQPLLNPGSLIGAIPVVEGKLSIADLTAKGAKPVEGAADTVSGMGETFRRSAGYLFLKDSENSPAGLSVPTDEIFSTDYKQPGNLAVISLNIKTLRDAAPNAYKQLLAAPALVGIPMADTAPLKMQLDKIDRFTFALATDDKNVHLKSWTTPYPAKPAKNAPRPTFPAGTLFQMHMVYPDAETAASIDTQIDALPDTMFQGVPPTVPPKIKALLKRIDKLNSGADAVSVAFNMKDGKGVFYLVSQMNQDYDLAAEEKGISDDIAAIQKEVVPNEKLNIEQSKYDASGKSAQRLAFTGNLPSEKIIVDGIQDGKTVYLTIAIDDGKYVEELAGTKMGAPSNLLVAGALDLTALLKAASEGGGPMMGMNPNMIQDLKTAFANQGITWTVQLAEQGYIYSDVQIPTVVIRQIIKTTQSAMGGGNTQRGLGADNGAIAP